MPSRRDSLAARRQALIIRSTELREQLSHQAERAAPILQGADQVWALVQGARDWARQHPQLLRLAAVAPVLLALLAGPGRTARLWRWGRRAWGGWRWLQRARNWASDLAQGGSEPRQNLFDELVRVVSQLRGRGRA